MNSHDAPLASGLLRRGFIRGYVITMRPYLLFVSGITGITGAAFSSTHSHAKIALIACTSFFAYGLGQALTDCFQVDTDSISSPYRPLTQGSIPRSLVLAVSGIGLTGCVLAFAALNPRTLPAGLLAGIGLLTYTHFKRRWWGGPFYNSWIVAALCIIGFLSGNRGSSFSMPDGFLLAAVLFGYANFVLVGYFKDISADRATGYRTLPVVFGRGPAALVSDTLALLTILSAASLVLRDSQNAMSLPASIFLFAGLIATILSQALLHGVSADEEAHTPIALTLHGYILLLAGMALSHRPGWFLPLVIFYGAFVFALSLRPEKSQI